ncbi:MAG: hypothetical protein ABIQ86_02785 [Steroidobacteraceae bacterium]
MKFSWLVVLVSVLSTPASLGFEAHLSAGLAVNIDRIAEPVVVDGVPMSMHRVTGAGVPEFARRIESLWRSQGSEVRILEQGLWTLRSRMVGARSEVIQSRTGPEGPELLWSSLDAGGPIQSAPDAGLTLPAGCMWGRGVSGQSEQHRYLQRSARCTLPIQELSRQLQRSVTKQGWRLLTTADRSLLLERPGAEGLLSLAVHDGDSATSLSWLRVERSR